METSMNEELKEIIGAGGGKGGGGGRIAQEAENTLRSAATVRVVEVVSEGEIAGIAGGAQGIYINDTPLQNSDTSYNFSRVQWDYRVGLPSQSYLQGFPAVEAETVINTPVTQVTPVTRTVSSADIDAARVTILFPQGLFQQNLSNGDITGTSVQFRIEKKLTSDGSWIVDATYTKDGKTNTPYEAQYRVERPAGIGTWDIRVVRVTADSAVSSLRNATTWSRLTEIQDNKLSYNDIALVGIAIDAESVGGAIPRRSYLVKGIICKVPSNYNPVTRVYTGIWDGTFINAWTDNPAWCLYDLITNARYGMGAFIDSSQVDKFSFYNAAVYCDELVPDGFGGQEPRFTFNAVINTREEAYRVLQTMAGSFRSQLLWVNGLITLTQDRPASPVKLITKANVIDGLFSYRSTGLFERHTVLNVSFNDRTDRHLQNIATVTDTAGIARYGFNELDIAAYGATTQGQAIRHGRWALDTELNQTELVQFRMAMNGFDLLPGDIVKVFDEDYTVNTGGGRIVSVVGTTVTVDRPIALVAGSTIDVTLADGKTIETKNITQTTGNLSTFTVNSAFSQAVLEGAVYIVKAAVSPRQFRLMGLRQEDDGIIAIEAVYHDPDKYARVEQGITITPPTFSGATSGLPAAPTNIVFGIEALKNPDGSIIRNLRVAWDPDGTGRVSSYRVLHRRDLNNNSEIKTFANSVSVPIDAAGEYKVTVFAVGPGGRESVGTSANYTVSLSSTGGLFSITNLLLKGGGVQWETSDFTVVWEDSATNTSPSQDYKIEVLTQADVLLRTEFVNTKEYTYSELKNYQDGGLRGVLKIRVTPRDLYGVLGTSTTNTFSNPAPAVIQNLNILGGLGSIKLYWDRNTEPDVAGYFIWRGTSAGFSPSAANVVFDGDATYVSDASLDNSTTYYYKVAAYDRFNKNLDGANLNISNVVNATTSAAPGIASGTTLPPDNTAGDIFFNTTDDKLYRWTGTAWTSAVDTSDLTGPIEATTIADGIVTTPKLAANAVVADKIASNAITSDKLLANAVTAGKIDAAAVTAGTIAANAVTTNTIAANAVVADKINTGAVTATKISVTSLSAITATIGTLRTATSGARTEIADNVIRVYDTGGVLRVKLGNLDL